MRPNYQAELLGDLADFHRAPVDRLSTQIHSSIPAAGASRLSIELFYRSQIGMGVEYSNKFKCLHNSFLCPRVSYALLAARTPFMDVFGNVKEMGNVTLYRFRLRLPVMYVQVSPQSVKLALTFQV